MPTESAERLSPCRYPATASAVFIGAAHYRRRAHGPSHPLSIPRVSLTFDLINAYGALSPAEYAAARPATHAELTGFHTEAYVAALARCEALGRVPEAERLRHNIGTAENPYFPGFFSTPALVTGSSIQGAEWALRGVRAFSPAGGMHHALPDSARGFCYFNDAVLAIQRLRSAGLRVLYVDIDAHHGDGVEQAFADDPDVFTLSLHMDTRYAYPFKGGRVTDQGGERGQGACLNVPLPVGTHDAEYRFVFSHLWPGVRAAFAPDAVVLQAGTDALFGDPLGKFRLSTGLFLEVVARIVADSPRLLVIGGGGYHPLLLARCWTGVWGVLSGRELPLAIPAAGQRLLRAVGWDQDEDEGHYESLFATRVEPGSDAPVRLEVEQVLEEIRAHHPLMRAL